MSGLNLIKSGRRFRKTMAEVDAFLRLPPFPMTKGEALAQEKRNAWRRFFAQLPKDFIRAVVIGAGLLIPFVGLVFFLRLALR